MQVVSNETAPSCIGDADLGELIAELEVIRSDMLVSQQSAASVIASVHTDQRLSAANLLHYLVLRRRNLCGLQMRLAERGLSSLGRAEAHVMATVDAVLDILRRLNGHSAPSYRTPESPTFCQGEQLLDGHAEALLGVPAQGRDVRIMVTMPREAANDPGLIVDLLRSGMDCMRINCAHDDVDIWAHMIAHLRAAEKSLGRRCRVAMDLAGPKLRTTQIESGRTGLSATRRDANAHITLRPGDLLKVARDSVSGKAAIRDDAGNVVAPASIGVTLPPALAHAKPGQPIWFDDGKIGAVIDTADADGLLVRITHARESGSKLRADKGINLPETYIELPALSAKDFADLEFAAINADVISLSFVNCAEDVELIQRHLKRLGSSAGLVLKIETQSGFEQLPQILLTAMRSANFGVMIARGDLAIECGFERLAEVQEEILWLCEAAHVPVIWATQVLESLAKKGQPSRAEISDAAMGDRAECVMLNKGPHVVEAVRMLDNILRRMQAHQNKKTAMLRELKLARRALLPRSKAES